MKRFLIITLIFASVICLTAAAICMYIDPYNVFHVMSYRENGIEPNKNYIKMGYILSEPDRFDTFIFGSSRVGYIDSAKIPDCCAYNMTYSMGVPSEHLDNIKTMLSHGIVPKRIIMEIDDISYRMSSDYHIDDQLRCPYEYLKRHPLKFAELYLCPPVAFESLEISQYSARNPEREQAMYLTGSTLWRSDTEYVFPEIVDLSGPSFMDDCINAVARCAELCRENGIEFTVFVTPLYKAQYLGALERGDYYTFLTKLASVTPFYNFSGLNDITVNSKNYVDVSHYNAQVGDLIIDTVFNGKQDEELLSFGFGYYTDKDNVSQLIAILEKGNKIYS